ncbi:MAG TPA: hypothetical protein VGC67_14675 [Cellulomonas sp.]
MTVLVESVQLRNGAVLDDRIVMAPMVTFSGNEDGTITDEQLAYYAERSQVGSMIIAETMYIDEPGLAFKGELGICRDAHMPGLTRLTETIKQHGAKAIAQLHHGGREAGVYFDRGGVPVVPSQMDLPFLDYPVRELSHDEIGEIVRKYGAATRRAIDAGFDGVEIHGANHYLIQQFFSAYSNRRTDEYGGSRDNRMRFALEVAQEVFAVVAQHAPAGFIVGIRISQEEVHGSTVGFDHADNVALIERLNDYAFDYLHISAMGDAVAGYLATPHGLDVTFGELYRQALAPETRLVLCGSILTPADAEHAVRIGDLAAIAREALMEPRFALKLHEGRASEIVSEISPERLDAVVWPEGLRTMIVQGFRKGNQTGHGYNTLVPLPNDESIIQYAKA